MSEPPDPPSFRENDLELLKSGNFADGIIKCQGRTWNIHRALLSSRLKFFQAAFSGAFVEAETREIDFPEADPDSVDIAIRHLYREVLDVEVLNTPLLCVSSWKFADYLQLDTLKLAAASSLQDHLDAMMLLASSNKDLKTIKPIWLKHFADAFREVCAHTALQPLQTGFLTILWVTRFEMLSLSEIRDVLDEHKHARNQLLELLIWHRPVPNGVWTLPQNCWCPETDVRRKEKPLFGHQPKCSGCCVEFKNLDTEEPRFYNPVYVPIPVEGASSFGGGNIGKLVWCKCCVDSFNKCRAWPWRNKNKAKSQQLRVQAWSWNDGDQDST